MILRITIVILLSRNQSFDSMLKNYHVKMPISEIAYLYEYIADDEDERKVASDDEF